ncbi:unnamed protein product [Candidula unifasciata]|uniref:Ubiquitin-specific peptidase-like SUMO isopeptidase domain-containing protein n=1 Tax=Candidula unifasciata TaxID=100452 RepID=A0A8S3Z907_9EUPU|nr:unnamed protein product [Candidula unifasciata]
MPATGILSNKHSQEEVEVQNLSTDSVHDSAGSLPAHENNKTEMSRTSEGSDLAAAAIQSSSLDVGPELSSSIPVTFSKINKGFQNTFSAVTSTSCGDANDETKFDVCTSAAVEDSHDSTQVPLTVSSFENEAEVENEQAVSTDAAADGTQLVQNTECDVDMESAFKPDLAAQGDCTESAASDCVYFIQTTDASGQVVTSVIDPNDISLYADSVIYKQWLNADGEIETTVVHAGSMEATQNHTQGETDTQQQDEQQIIYTHDVSGQLIQLDPDQYTNDMPPPGKQFVYMQDTSGRIIRTVVDASQNMVPGQQVYYTQSDDGQIITSLMDSSTAAAGSDGEPQVMDIAEHQTMSDEGVSELPPVNNVNSTDQQLKGDDAVVTDEELIDVGTSDHQQSHADIASQQKSGVDTKTQVIDRGARFSIDNTMSGLSMLAELSHLTSGQVVTPATAEELKLPPVMDSCSSIDMDGFRPVAKMTEQAPSCREGLESVSSDIAELKVTEADSDSLDHGSLSQTDSAGHSESLLARIVSQISRVSPSFCRDNLFVQWQNLDAMCWMDVVLIMLVHSPSLRPLCDLDSGHELASTLLVTLLKANRQAQILLQNLLKKHSGAVLGDLNSAAPVQDPKTSKLVCKENMDEIGKAINVLYGMREKIWQALQPRLRCERGKHNSPVAGAATTGAREPDGQADVHHALQIRL